MTLGGGDTVVEMTPERLAEIEARAAVATPGPWVWDERRFNERERRNRRGRGKGEQFVWALRGALDWPCDETLAGPYDYARVMYLMWHQVKGTALVNAGPDPDDAAFIAAARTDIPDLIAALRQAWEERDELAAQNQVMRASAVLIDGPCEHGPLLWHCRPGSDDALTYYLRCSLCGEEVEALSHEEANRIGSALAMRSQLRREERTRNGKAGPR